MTRMTNRTNRYTNTVRPIHNPMDLPPGRFPKKKREPNRRFHLIATCRERRTFGVSWHIRCNVRGPALSSLTAVLSRHTPMEP